MPHHPPRRDQSFVVGLIPTQAGDVPQVAAQLRWTDHWGAIRPDGALAAWII